LRLGTSSPVRGTVFDLAAEGSMTDRIGLESLVHELRDFVLEAKHGLDDEIRAYPTPIPRCDEQFNHLYEQRSRLSDVAARIKAICAEPDDRELVQFIDEFIASARLTDDALEPALRRRLRAALATSSSPCAG